VGHRADDTSARWEAFARKDPQFYIDPTLGRDADAEQFIEGGRGVVEQVLEWTGELGAYDRALEIGCGIGRDTVHLARHFRHVDGVDVSETMVRNARERGLPENVRLHVLSGRDLGAFDSESVSFVFSHLVFQHMTDDATVESYLREITRVLRPGGVAAVQFDTRRTRLLVGLVQQLPDPLLPSIRRRGIRRHRRPASQIRTFARAARLTLDAERDPGTAEHWFRWRRDESSVVRG
jgi:ubiquinone/menaquinone biosynthesis C-methylase UbiE